MRRLVSILVLCVTVGALVLFGSAAGGEEGTYEVRAIFDNGAFLVEGEEVRVAGAKVGSISEVGVTGAEEAATADGSPDPGKAVVVMRIDDPGFQDFREDASCFIRPQSLLGEKFVECQLTEPRAPGTEPPPELEEIGEGEPGEGQRLLPLESNGKAVDIDLVNNIMREPYPDRFRLIINDLGAALAARGEDLESVIERSNPALQRTDEVLAILAKQNKQLAQLARDGDRSLQPLAAKRDNLGNFINAAATTAAATAERRADLEAGFQKLPGFLRELEATMVELDRFNEASTPVLSDLNEAAPDLTRINTALGPFADAGTVSLKSLGDAAEASGPDLVASQPVLRQVAGVAEISQPVTRTLRTLLANLRNRNGYRNLTKAIYNIVGSFNAFDSYGHFIRQLLPVNNCVDYDVVPEAGCDANFTRVVSKSAGVAKEQDGGAIRNDRIAKRRALESVQDALDEGEPPIDIPFLPDPEPDPDPEEPAPADPAPQSSPDSESSKLLLDYLYGPQQASGKGGRR